MKDEKIQTIISEETTNKTLKDTESRWTKEGLLDIREEDTDEPAKPSQAAS